MSRATSLRTAAEIAVVRGYVREHLEVVRPEPGEFSAIRCEAITASLDWVEGVVPAAPLSGVILAPTERAIAEEMLVAGDEEQELLRQRRRAAYPGVVHETLQWVLGQASEPI